MKTLQLLKLVSATMVFGMIGCGGTGEMASDGSPVTLEQALSCGASQVPVMTSLTAPSGVISRSGAYSGTYEATNAFDGKSSLWISAVNQTPAFIDYKWADGPRTITNYAIKFANGSLTSRAPKDWTLQGWNGSSWVVVDTEANQINWAGVERREYTVNSPGAYTGYRLNVTDDNDTRAGVVVVSIDELQLFSCGPVVHTLEWYLQQAGLPLAAQLGQTRVVDGACDVLAEQGAGTFNSGVTQECTWQQDFPGWQIISSSVDVLENKYGRGSYSTSIIAKDGWLTVSEKELGDKWKGAIDMAVAFDDIEAKTKLELEYQHQKEYFYSVASNMNSFYLKAVANGGLFRKSVMHVKGNVTLVRIY